MTRSIITIGTVLAGAVAAVALMWAISPPDFHNGLRKDAEAIYCASPANKVSLREAMAALGSGTTYMRACNALVELHDPDLESSSAADLNWQSILLGSSVIAALITAVFNVRSATVSARRARIESLADAASGAYKNFSREARKHVELLQTQARPSLDDLRNSYHDLEMSLMRLSRSARKKPLQDASACFRHFDDWPVGPDAERPARLKAATDKINKLGESIGELESILSGKHDSGRRNAR